MSPVTKYGLRPKGAKLLLHILTNSQLEHYAMPIHERNPNFQNIHQKLIPNFQQFSPLSFFVVAESPNMNSVFFPISTQKSMGKFSNSKFQQLLFRLCSSFLCSFQGFRLSLPFRPLTASGKMGVHSAEQFLRWVQKLKSFSFKSWKAYRITDWWLNQPIWKIWSSKWESSATSGENKTYLKPPPRLII